MLVYPSGIDVSSSALRFLTDRLSAQRRQSGTRWRRLSAGRQALLALAHLRCGHTYAQLAAGFGVGTTTAYRYVAEAVELPAALAPDLSAAVEAASRKAFVILDGTLLPIDRIAADRPYYSGKHRKHGMNVQVITDPFGRLLWASAALPGAVHDIKEARTHGIIDVLVDADLPCWADQAVLTLHLTCSNGVNSTRSSIQRTSRFVSFTLGHGHRSLTRCRGRRSAVP